MGHLKVNGVPSSLELGLDVVGRLVRVVGVQLVDEALIRGLGEQALLIEDREDTKWLNRSRKKKKSTQIWGKKKDWIMVDNYEWLFF